MEKSGRKTCVIAEKAVPLHRDSKTPWKTFPGLHLQAEERITAGSPPRPMETEKRTGTHARLVQLLQQVWQDRVCQSDEPPEHGACLLGTQEIQAFPSQAHCQGSHLAARDSGQRPQSFLSLAERSDPKVMSLVSTY